MISEPNFLKNGITRKVFLAEDKNYVVKELVDNCPYNANLVEWYVFKYSKKSKYGSKIYNFLNPCIEISKDSKYLIMPYCELNQNEISWNIFGTQVNYFWDWKKKENWGYNNKSLKLIDYGFLGNIYVLQDLDIFKEIKEEIEK